MTLRAPLTCRVRATSLRTDTIPACGWMIYRFIISLARAYNLENFRQGQFPNPGDTPLPCHLLQNPKSRVSCHLFSSYLLVSVILNIFSPKNVILKIITSHISFTLAHHVKYYNYFRTLTQVIIYTYLSHPCLKK